MCLGLSVGRRLSLHTVSLHDTLEPLANTEMGENVSGGKGRGEGEWGERERGTGEEERERETTAYATLQ